jgi:arylsulfatase A-like enzyme
MIGGPGGGLWVASANPPEDWIATIDRIGDWKAVRLAPTQPLELYDLKADRGETHNVAADHPDVVARIEAYLKTARTEQANK